MKKLRPERDPETAEEPMKKVTIYTDGGCRPNPGRGGWAAILRYKDKTRELAGGEPSTTNNRMEMQAALQALSALKEPCRVELYTDSQYLRQGITSWIVRWKANGWRTASRQPVQNADLWRALDEAMSRHQVNWRWVRGHSGHEWNERCDQLAQQQIDKPWKAPAR